MKRLSLYGIAAAFGHFLALNHRGKPSDIVLQRVLHDVLYFMGGWCECTSYQVDKAESMMTDRYTRRLASLKKYDEENPDAND